MAAPEPTPGERPEAQEVTLDLNFVPTWARQGPGVNPYAHFQGRPERSDRPERGHGSNLNLNLSLRRGRAGLEPAFGNR